MLFHTLILVGGLALEAAANPVPGRAVSGSRAGRQTHAIVDAAPKAQAARRRSRSPAPPHAETPRTIPTTHALHERQPPHWSHTWQRTHRVPADAVLPMRIGLKQRNLDKGHDRLMAVADPRSPQFGKHMTSDEVVAYFAPERTAVDAVVGWLTGSGIDIDRISQSANKQWIQFDATAAEAETLLMTDYYVFEHDATGTRDVAADHYHLPHVVRAHVDYVTPGIRLRRDVAKEKKQKRERERATKAMTVKPRGMHAMHETPHPIEATSPFAAHALPPLNSSTCYEYVTPECIRTQYNIPLGSKAYPGNELGIFESLAQHYNKEDLDNYFKVVSPTIPPGTYPQERLIDGAEGATSVAEAGSEAELDFQAAMPLIYPQQAVLYQVDDERIQANMTMGETPYLGFWNTFFDAIDGSYCSYSAFGETGNCVKPECLDPAYPDTAGGPGSYNGSLQCGVYAPTNVISISYGGGEADLPAYYWQRQCSEILKLGLQGVTVVISSGDSGVASSPFDGGNPNGCGGSGQIFYPASEATCPYVLAVGGTEFHLAAPLPSTNSSSSSSNTTSAAPPLLTERATSRFPSGGGFSNVFAQPAYQASAVADYFEQVQGRLAFSGYATPGTNFSEVGSGVYHTGGRGYPDVAAVGDHYVTMLNGQWATIGGTSLSAPVWASMLTLVNEERLAAGKATVGFVNPVLYDHPDVFNDVTAGSNPGCGTTGFLAAKGWDPVTGLGTPKFPELVKLFLSLP
ncbi:alkaline serine protease [Niveomyces insectorum RCEF 264]|uniref:tripeptidyl-peptidase II n=1 Tax=Niveomyces insectorum RCEF 264 TaxID=1081102 RepID=A0A167YNZ9_9HYPO|nr:alkaline serine protease [Niveomyces insectorum RCEF 264]